MKLRPKLVIYLLLIASIPLSLAMLIALWQSSNQTRSLTLDIVQGYLDAGAENLSGYFDSRKAEISAYAQVPLLKEMNFTKIRPFLLSELVRHDGIYEKFILGTPEGYFYNTAGGNPAQNGLRTFDDNDKNAKLKTISKRDYWINTIGNNREHQNRIFVSEPMISYTTGAKQIVVAANIKSKDQKVVGMIGGALPWKVFKTQIKHIFNPIIKNHNWDSRFFLVTRNGVYWYHWDPSYVVHLEKDSTGRNKVNNIGEKVTVVKKITDDSNTAIAQAGNRMVSGQRGYTLYKDPVTKEELYLVFAPIKSNGYSVGLVVPKSQMMAPVSRLQYLFMFILMCAVIIAAFTAWTLSKRIVGPITSLNNLIHAASEGEINTKLIPVGNDEVTELTASFNTLIISKNNRENSIKELNEELEHRVAIRTNELENAISKRKETEEQLLRDSEALKNLNKITADPNDKFETKLHKILKLGQKAFNLELGIISRIVDDEYIIEYIIGPDDIPSVGTKFDLEHTYCSHTYAANRPVAFDHTGSSSIANHPCYQNFKLESYVGAPIIVDGLRYGTLNFSSPQPHAHPFSNNELTLIQLLAQWIGNELSRSRSERELGRFKTTLDLTMDCVFMFEPDTLNFFYVNQGAINQIGYSNQELIHMKPYDIKPEFTESEFKKILEPMLSGKQNAINFETIHQHKNGKKIPVEIFLQYINPKGELPRFVAIVRDITERQNSTQKLNEILEEMTLRTREITLLSSLGDLLHSCQDLSEAYDVVSQYMPMLLPQLSGALYLAKETGVNFEKVGFWGDEPPRESYFPAEDCVAVRRGLSYLTKENESVLFCKHHPIEKPTISLCMPLAAQGETFGILHLQCMQESNELKSDTEDTIDTIKNGFAETVAKQVAMALASLRLKEQLRSQSIRDPLTGLFNRRYMDETFEREIIRALRNRISLSIIMLDIDHFKTINDSYGHETGDAVLKELGEILRNITRTEDIACRYGGEEFVICLPGAELSTASTRAELIRETMSSTKFYHEGKTMDHVTVSLGVSVYPDHGENALDLIKTADKALYQAKESGRNQVVIAQSAIVIKNTAK